MDKPKSAWIIGASSGIGKALAELLVKNNWKVAISSRTQKDLDEIAKQHKNLYPSALDLTDIETLEKSKDDILQQFGSIDAVFFNAGDYTPMPLNKFDPELFQKLMTINFHGVVNGLNTILPYMQKKKSGEIYITGSLAGYRGLPKAAPYNASKAAVISLAESLHLELKLQGISLRLINPGFVESPLTSKNDFKMPFILVPKKQLNIFSKNCTNQTSKSHSPNALPTS